MNLQKQLLRENISQQPKRVGRVLGFRHYKLEMICVSKFILLHDHCIFRTARQFKHNFTFTYLINFNNIMIVLFPLMCFMSVSYCMPHIKCLVNHSLNDSIFTVLP